MLAGMGNVKPQLVIPVGIDVESKTYLHSGFEMNIFYIGALDWTPNQEGLLWFIDNCLPLVLKHSPDVKLKVAGRNAPDWLARKLSHPHIEFLGEIDDASTFMHENGVMIVPLFSGSGMRVKIIEGMSHSKAIVTTPVGCEGIDAENKKVLFVAETPEAFSENVITLLTDREKLDDMGAKALQFVHQQFDNGVLISHLVDFYKQHLS
jgi:glycosyltransferase involved in cell wall biosynthesis